MSGWSRLWPSIRASAAVSRPLQSGRSDTGRRRRLCRMPANAQPSSSSEAATSRRVSLWQRPRGRSRQRPVPGGHPGNGHRGSGYLLDRRRHLRGLRAATSRGGGGCAGLARRDRTRRDGRRSRCSGGSGRSRWRRRRRGGSGRSPPRRATRSRRRFGRRGSLGARARPSKAPQGFTPCSISHQSCR